AGGDDQPARLTLVKAAVYDEAAAIERMLDDGAPTPPRRRARRGTSTRGVLPCEPSWEQRVALRNAAKRVFHLHCVAFARADERGSVPPRPHRCPHCGGTMLAELAAD